MRNADMPAMPLTEDQIDRSERGNGYEGMSKREYFAGLAMQGLTNSAFKYMSEGDGHATEAAIAMMRDIGKVSCDMADALLAELDKEQQS